MEGFSGLIFLAIVYAVLSLISKAQKGKTTPGKRRSGQGKTWYPEPPPDHVQASGTQAEGARLQELLRAMEGAKERASRGPSGLESAYRLRGAEEVEAASRAAVLDYDDDASALVQRRILQAEERNRPRTEADHTAFDARIRQTNVAVSAGVPDHIQQLRDAIIWKEILGKPVSLRD